MKKRSIESMTESIQDKLEIFLFGALSILLMPYIFYRTNKDKRYKQKAPGAIEIEFDKCVDFNYVDNSYLGSSQYLAILSDIKSVYKRYLAKHEEEFGAVEGIESPISLMFDPVIDFEYSKKGIFGLESKYIRTKTFSHCIIINSDFPYKEELYSELRPLYIKLGEYVCEYKFTYYSQISDSNKTAMGIY